MKKQVRRTSIVLMTLATLGLSMSRFAMAQNQKRYSVTDLGTLGGTFSLAGGMNNKGSVIGFSTCPATQSCTPFFGGRA